VKSWPSTSIEMRAAVGHGREIKACFSDHSRRLPLFGGTTTIPRCRLLSSARPCNRGQFGVKSSRITISRRFGRGMKPRFGTVRSQVRIVSPKLFCEVSPSTITSTGFSRHKQQSYVIESAAQEREQQYARHLDSSHRSLLLFLEPEWR
jgi:hypothetical protein